MTDFDFQQIIDNAKKDLRIKEIPTTPIKAPETTDEKLNALIEFIRNMITNESEKAKFNHLFPKPKK